VSITLIDKYVSPTAGRRKRGLQAALLTATNVANYFKDHSKGKA